MDEDGPAISGAEVLVVGECCNEQLEPRKCTATSDATGVAKLRLPGGGPCDFEINAEGYQSVSHRIETSCDGEFIDEVTLQRDDGL
ncbi:MAG: hypothetical protein R3B89_35155 [Polyangiaceae bacterium]